MDRERGTVTVADRKEQGQGRINRYWDIQTKRKKDRDRGGQGQLDKDRDRNTLGGGAMSLAEVENMAALHSFTLGGSGDMLPQEILVILDVLRCILVHSEACREAHIELLEKRLIIKIILASVLSY